MIYWISRRFQKIVGCNWWRPYSRGVSVHGGNRINFSVREWVRPKLLHGLSYKNICEQHSFLIVMSISCTRNYKTYVKAQELWMNILLSSITCLLDTTYQILKNNWLSNIARVCDKIFKILLTCSTPHSYRGITESSTNRQKIQPTYKF